METGVDLSRENYGKLLAPRLSKELLEVKTQLIECEAKANAIIKYTSI